MPKSLIPVLALSLGLALGGCNKDDGKPRAGTTSGVALPAARTVSMKIGPQDFQLEVADNDVARERGLMYRESMPADHGMIFVFGEEHEQSFWMKNTLIPLDIVFVNAAGTVVSIKAGIPLQEDPAIPSDAPMKWAIELNSHAAAKAGLKIGDKLTIPPAARDAQGN